MRGVKGSAFPFSFSPSFSFFATPSGVFILVYAVLVPHTDGLFIVGATMIGETTDAD